MPKSIDARRYQWEPLENHLADLLAVAAERKIAHREVEVRNLDKVTYWQVNSTYHQEAPGRYFTYYGRGRASQSEAAIEFEDKCVLVCVTTRSFKGTFSSGDDVSVNYYLLRPANA